MIKLPDDIKAEMDLWRTGRGEWNVPRSYIDFHCRLANEDMRKQDWVILEDHGLVHDGWGDGMKTKQLVVACKGTTGEWKTYTVKWDESGAWFFKSHGWIRFKERIV